MAQSLTGCNSREFVVERKVRKTTKSHLRCRSYDPYESRLLMWNRNRNAVEVYVNVSVNVNDVRNRPIGIPSTNDELAIVNDLVLLSCARRQVKQSEIDTRNHSPKMTTWNFPVVIVNNR
jgi:hypothetical protein